MGKARDLFGAEEMDGSNFSDFSPVIIVWGKIHVHGIVRNSFLAKCGSSGANSKIMVMEDLLGHFRCGNNDGFLDAKSKGKNWTIDL